MAKQARFKTFPVYLMQIGGRMPFTLYHLGFALLIGYFTRKKIHWPTFILASVVIDLEPLLVFIGVLNHYPLHGYMHTFLVGALCGIPLGYAMYKTRRTLNRFFEKLALVENEIGVSGYIIGGLIGWELHVLMDSPLYSDIKPFYPIQINPLYNAWDYPSTALATVMLAGVFLYAFHVFRKRLCRR